MASLSYGRRTVAIERGALYPEDSFAAADSGRAGAHSFEDHTGFHRLQERVELRARPGELDGIALVGDVEDIPAKNVGEPLHFFAILSGGAHLDQHQLALDVIAFRQV